MKFEVELNMFAPGKIRTVTVPREQMRKKKTKLEKLDLIFFYGQNDFQPLELPSVSVGDVIRFEGERWMIMSIGFRKLKPGEYATTRPKLEDIFQFHKQKKNEINDL